MRFAEVALLALPFVVFVAWRIVAPSAGPPKTLVIAVAVTVMAMAALLFTFWYEEAQPPGVGYVPARLENGRVVPERVEPRAAGETAPPAGSPAGPPSGAARR